MKEKCSKIINKAKAVCDSKYFLIGLALFDFSYTFINIYIKTYSLGILFLVLNSIALILLSKRKALYIIFGLYPLSRVLKIPSLDTSLLTVLLLIYCAKLLVLGLSEKEKLKKHEIEVLIIYLTYVVFTFVVSLINKNESFQIAPLASYYLYLSLPILIFVTTKSQKDMNIIACITICMASYLFGICTTIIYYQLVPNGAQILKNAGVNIFDMGNAGLRFSPLTDDPNYGTALILLLSGLFIASKKTKKESCVGYPIIIVSLALSCLSISKMFIIGLVILLVCFAISAMNKIHNSIISSIIVLNIVLLIVSFLSSNLGTNLIIRTIGTKGSVTLNRITSGRTELFGAYSSYILSNPLTLLFGKGPLYFDSSLFWNGEHNTFTKTIFGSGMLGVTMMLSVFIIMAKNRLKAQPNIPQSLFFIGFILCLLLCCMSLAVTPSTIFPVIVTSAQFVNFKDRERRAQDFEVQI